MFSSGAVKTSIGSALTDFGRDDVIDAEQRLIGNKAMGSDLVWVLTNVMAAQARKTRVGGADSPIYLWTNSGRVNWEGRLGGDLSGEPASIAYQTNELGKTDTTPLKRTSLAVATFMSQNVAAHFGQGIEYRWFRPPMKDLSEHSLHDSVDFAQVNPKNAEILYIA